MSEGLVLTFLIWAVAHITASGWPEEAWEPDRMAVLHHPGTGTEARLVWTGDGPRLAAAWLSARSVPEPTAG